MKIIIICIKKSQNKQQNNLKKNFSQNKNARKCCEYSIVSVYSTGLCDLRFEDGVDIQISRKTNDK